MKFRQCRANSRRIQIRFTRHAWLVRWDGRLAGRKRVDERKGCVGCMREGQRAGGNVRWLWGFQTHVWVAMTRTSRGLGRPSCRLYRIRQRPAHGTRRIISDRSTVESQGLGSAHLETSTFLGFGTSHNAHGLLRPREGVKAQMYLCIRISMIK